MIKGPNTISKIKIVECPRDAMQGWKDWIPTELKISYLNQLLQVGFDTLDFGSFVSEKAIPQLRDTATVLNGLDLSGSTTKLLAIVANTRGAIEAASHKFISCIGFPFSISETFQLRNTHKTIAASTETTKEIVDICSGSGKEPVIYISMGFGNPYGDPYNEEIVFEWVDKLIEMNIGIISIADTVGLANPNQIQSILSKLILKYPHVEIGVHLHSTFETQQEKIVAALQAGCIRFDGALKGIGGCPMADDELVGNINTEELIRVLNKYDKMPLINEEALNKSLVMAGDLFHT